MKAPLPELKCLIGRKKAFLAHRDVERYVEALLWKEGIAATVERDREVWARSRGSGFRVGKCPRDFDRDAR